MRKITGKDVRQGMGFDGGVLMFRKTWNQAAMATGILSLIVMGSAAAGAQELDDPGKALVAALEKPIGGQYDGDPRFALFGATASQGYEYGATEFKINMPVQPVGPIRLHFVSSLSPVDVVIDTPAATTYDLEAIRNMGGMIQEAQLPESLPEDKAQELGLRPGYNLILEIPSSGAGDYVATVKPRKPDAGGDQVSFSAKWLRVADIGDPMQKVGLFFVDPPQGNLMTFDPLTFQMAVEGLSDEIKVSIGAKVVKREDFKDIELGEVPLTPLPARGGRYYYGTGLTLNVAGTYALIVTLTRSDIPEGGLKPGFMKEKSASYTFLMEARPARYTGKITLRLPDEDDNGKAEKVIYDVQVRVEEAGEYSVAITLFSKDNKSKTQSTRMALEQGFQSVPVEFPAADILELGGTGPFKLELATLIKHGADGDVPMKKYTANLATDTFDPRKLEGGPNSE